MKNIVFTKNKLSNNYKQLLIVMMTVMLLVFVLVKSSYALLNQSVSTGNTDILVEFGSLQVVLSTENDSYTFNDDYQKPVNDLIGLNQDGYNFSIKNLGSIKVGYYEIKLVDQENKLSTLPHKYIKFSINKNNGLYDSPRNLADSQSIIYAGTDLNVGEEINFNLKIWIDEDTGINAYNKNLYGALEITLYQEYDDDYYIAYDSNLGINTPSKTPIYLKRITTDIPTRDGYLFQGWTLNKDSQNIIYDAGDEYKYDKGVILYAKWEEMNIINTFPSSITEFHKKIKEVSFIKDSFDNINKRYNNSTVKEDITYNNHGQVLCWLEINASDNTMYTLYVASDKMIYLHSGNHLFNDYTNLEYLNFDNANISYINDTTNMFTTTSADINYNIQIIVNSVLEQSFILDLSSNDRSIAWDSTNVLLKE